MNSKDHEEKTTQNIHPISESIYVLNQGIKRFLDELKRISDSSPQLKHYVSEMESIRSFLETLNLIKDTMSEDRLRDSIRNTLKSIHKNYENIPSSIQRKLTGTPLDKEYGLPEFLIQSFHLIGPRLRLSKNEMKAWIEVDKEDAALLSPKVIIDSLKQNGIVNGIDEEKIHEIFEYSLFNQEVCVAKGKLQQQGEDGRIEYLVHVHDLSRAPKELENGRVTFKDIDLFSYVNAGDKIAQKIPPAQGTPGYTVTNRVLQPLQAEEVELTAFENTKVTQDGIYLIAAMDGCITKQNGRIFLQPTLRIAGNVSYETGNINSKVTVYIAKDVLSGFSVNSESDIFVQGVVEGAKLESKGNIVIQGGIQGKEKAEIEANGDVTARFISNATVSSLNNIYVERGINNSKIWAGRRLVLSGSEAEIVGGEIEADAVVLAGVIGSEMQVKTVVKLGGRVEDLSTLIMKTEEKIAEQEEIVDKCDNIIKVLKQQMDQSPTPSEEMKQSMAKARKMSKEARQNIDQLYHEIDGLRVQYEESFESLRSVRVRNNIMPGTVINIQGVELDIQEPAGPATVVKQGDVLAVLPFKELEES